MPKRLKYPPAILNKRVDAGPAKIEDKIILTLSIKKVSLKPKVSRQRRVIILLRPSFAPGKIRSRGLGIKVSKIYRARLYATIKLNKINFLVLVFFIEISPKIINKILKY